MLLLALVACGPDPIVGATAAVGDAGVEGAVLEGGPDRFTFQGTRHGLPCRGTVRVGDPPTVEAAACPPVAADEAPFALYTHLLDLGLEEIRLTGGPERWVVAASGCSGNATRLAGGALKGEVRCGAERHPFTGIFPDRPLRDDEQQELAQQAMGLATAAGLVDVVVTGVGSRLEVVGSLSEQPCKAEVDLWGAPDDLRLDPETCPGAGPPPEALASRSAWLAWVLAEDGFTDVVVGADRVVATLGADRLEGRAVYSGPRVTVSLGGERAVVRILTLPTVLQ